MSVSRPKLSSWKIFVLILGAYLLIGVVWVGFLLYQLKFTADDSYNAWRSGELVVGYLEAHTNRWPRSWEDLETVTNSYSRDEDFSPVKRLRGAVKLDWNADIGQLQQIARNGTNGTIHVVTRLDGLPFFTHGPPLFPLWGSEPEANAKILRYLRASLGTNGDVPETVVTLPSASPHP